MHVKVGPYKDVICVEEDRLAGSDPTRGIAVHVAAEQATPVTQRREQATAATRNKPCRPGRVCLAEQHWQYWQPCGSNHPEQCRLAE